MCGLQPQIGVGAAVSAAPGVMCAALREKMILHDAAVIPYIGSLSDDNSRGERYEILAEVGADLACVSYVGPVWVEAGTEITTSRSSPHVRGR